MTEKQTSSRPKEARKSKLQLKKMLITSFDINMLLALNSFHMARQLMEKMKRIREAMHRKRPEVWPSDWFPHRDNAPTHEALSLKQFLAQNRLLKWNIHPVSLIWLRTTSGCFRNNVCLKGTKISGC